jgi:hypothetical protein
MNVFKHIYRNNVLESEQYESANNLQMCQCDKKTKVSKV